MKPVNGVCSKCRKTILYKRNELCKNIWKWPPLSTIIELDTALRIIRYFFVLNIDRNNGKINLEDESTNELVALREQPVNEIRVKKSILCNSGSGSASASGSGSENASTKNNIKLQR